MEKAPKIKWKIEPNEEDDSKFHIYRFHKIHKGIIYRILISESPIGFWLLDIIRANQQTFVFKRYHTIEEAKEAAQRWLDANWEFIN
jgi:hypothetical protein